MLLPVVPDDGAAPARAARHGRLVKRAGEQSREEEEEEESVS
jgi:hypothetical protein